MNKFRFDVSLRVRHPTLDPDFISKEMGLLADHKWKVGDQRRTPKGDLLDGYYKETYCVFRIAHDASDELADVIREMTLRLMAHIDFLREIASTGGRLEYFIGWYSNGNSGEEFDVNLIKKLAELGIGLSFDFYGDLA